MPNTPIPKVEETALCFYAIAWKAGPRRLYVWFRKIRPT